MEKETSSRAPALGKLKTAPTNTLLKPLFLIATIATLLTLHQFPISSWSWGHCPHKKPGRSPYGKFPHPDDPFLFQPCTDVTDLPALEDAHPQRTWARAFIPDPHRWIWGNKSEIESKSRHGEFDGRGIYMCGYLDVPLDYTNSSDKRITRLAVTKYQVAGLDFVRHGHGHAAPGNSKNKKSNRTIVIEPGGPGGSGVSYAFRAAEDITKRLSGGEYDVLGWDPRGVNASLPAISCYPYASDRDRWSLYATKYRKVSDPWAQLEVADAMNDALFKACSEKYGDLARFVSTAFVARDMEEIRKALDEDELTGYLVSYGTGIGQTYANMFPDSVGRMILDGTEYVRDHRKLGGFGWTALDNVTDAWHDGFLGECVNAGKQHCALAEPIRNDPLPTVKSLEERMKRLFDGLALRPKSAYTEFSGPSLVTYSSLVAAVYASLYNAKSWPALARMLLELEAGNSTLAATFLEHERWMYDPTKPPNPGRKPASDDLSLLVICADAYDAPLPAEGLIWWDTLWEQMTHDSWIAGDSRFSTVFPCRHFTKYWPEPAEVYRGDLDKALRNPVLLIAETYDPATPLRNGRRLLNEMGWENARLVHHHGYGHSSRDTSRCTDDIAKKFIMEGIAPEDSETDCFADEKPYLYGTREMQVGAFDPVRQWREHIEEMATLQIRV